MSATPPPSHQVIRVTWSVVHTLLVLTMIGVAVVWWVTDGQGSALTTSWWAKLTEIQQTIAHSVRYPWDPS